MIFYSFMQILYSSSNWVASFPSIRQPIYIFCTHHDPNIVDMNVGRIILLTLSREIYLWSISFHFKE